MRSNAVDPAALRSAGRARLTIWFGLAGACAYLGAATALELHYAPREDLERVDASLIDDAGETIEMAAYVLSDQTVIQALIDAADRGVVIRLYLDKSQYAEHDPRRGGKIGQLLAYPNVSARVKGRGVLMHLKAYVVDHHLLRTGSGNFSQSGLERQDNDLVVLDDPQAVAAFERNFEAMFARAANLVATDDAAE